MVLGNGESRISFRSKQEIAAATGLDLEQLEALEWPVIMSTYPQVRAYVYGFYTRLARTITMIGCNAIYRHWYPDWLVSVDPKMDKEIKTSKFPKERFRFKPVGGAASGPAALGFAAARGHSPIFIAGMDLGDCQRHDKRGLPLTNNVFRDTENYHKSTVLQVSPTSWMQHMALAIHHHPTSRFIQVGPPFSLRGPFAKWHAQPHMDDATAKVYADRMEFVTWDELIKEYGA